MDFGLSLSSGAEGREHAAGTLPYMAPELFCGGDATEQSDLYAVGVIAHQMLARRHPFSLHGRPAELIAQELPQEPDLSSLPIELRGSRQLSRRRGVHRSRAADWDPF